MAPQRYGASLSYFIADYM